MGMTRDTQGDQDILDTAQIGFQMVTSLDRELGNVQNSFH